MKPLFSTLLCLGVLTVGAPLCHAFSGENPLQGNPWYHEELSENAAKASGFTAGAADSMAWNSDYLDSYLYSPIWWVQGAKNGPTGAIDRFRIMLMTGPEMEKLHFDDLFAAPRVHQAWKRYTIGAFAGMMWASENNDVAAAQNIVGISLHAMQDFYSHSSWVDDSKRQKLTYMDMTVAERSRQPIFTGAYELSQQGGVKHHGKFLPSAAIFKRPAVNALMKTACSAISPYSKSAMCDQYRLSANAVSVSPDLAGGKVPEGIVYVAPTGIALDNKWLAPIAVKERGLKGADGQPMNSDLAFQMAYDLAAKQSAQWLSLMGKAMESAGQGAFWNRVKTTTVAQDARERQFENYGQLPYLFMTAGPYHQGDGEGIYLRLKIRTASERMAGTNADIEVTANGRTDVLDWGRGVNQMLAYNDFERGDHDSYMVGPYASLPAQIVIKNNAPNAKDKLRALGQDFKNGFVAAGRKFKDVALSAIGGHADVVAENKVVWMPEDLNRFGATPTSFTVALDGASEGNYSVTGKISRVARADGFSTFRVELSTLKCHNEAKWDRGSNSDEPFTLAALNPLPGAVQKYRTPVFDDVDSGESRAIGHVFGLVKVPDDYGILTLALMQMESDDEGNARREQALTNFVGAVEEPTRNVKSQFVTAIADGIAPDWKVSGLEIYAFDRRTNVNTPLQMGTVHQSNQTFEIEGRKSRTIPLNAAGFRSRGVTRSMLLNENNQLGLVPGAATLLDLGGLLNGGAVDLGTRKPPKKIIVPQG